MEQQAKATPMPSGPASAVVKGAEIVGYLDAVSKDRVFGWAWNRRMPEERVEIHVLDGDTEIGRVVADKLRADLKGSGIGDGRHAFEFQMPPSFAGSLSKVKAFAKSASGDTLYPLQATAAEPMVAGAELDGLRQKLDLMLGQQNQIHRAAQATFGAIKVLAEREVKAPEGSAEARSALDEVKATQAALQEQLRSLEIFVTRLDTGLRGLVESTKSATPRSDRPLLVLIAALTAAALAASLARFAM